MNRRVSYYLVLSLFLLNAGCITTGGFPGSSTTPVAATPPKPTPCPYQGLKKIVAVSNFENKTSYVGQINLDSGMADQLIDALMQSGMFVVLEREMLKDVMEEQDLAATGRTAKSASARTGSITSAQILIKGTVTEFEDKSSGSGQGVNFGGFNFGMQRSEAHVGLIIRLIDTTTGQVLDSQRVEGKAEAGGLAWGANVQGVNFGTEGFKKTPLGKAVQMAVDNAVVYVTERLGNLTFKGRIVNVKDNIIYVSVGSTIGAKAGDTFTVFSRGEELVDPVTGELLGSEEKRVGRIGISEVRDKFSKAVILEGEGFKAGDIIYNEPAQTPTAESAQMPPAELAQIPTAESAQMPPVGE